MFPEKLDFRAFRAWREGLVQFSLFLDFSKGPLIKGSGLQRNKRPTIKQLSWPFASTRNIAEWKQLVSFRSAGTANQCRIVGGGHDLA
jgi:hypothetical protein